MQAANHQGSNHSNSPIHTPGYNTPTSSPQASPNARLSYLDIHDFALRADSTHVEPRPATPPMDDLLTNLLERLGVHSSDSDRPSPNSSTPDSVPHRHFFGSLVGKNLRFISLENPSARFVTPGTNQVVDLFLGQLSCGYKPPHVTHLINELLGHDTVVKVSSGPSPSCGFVTILQDDLAAVRAFSKNVLCDRDGVWVATNEAERELLEGAVAAVSGSVTEDAAFGTDGYQKKVSKSVGIPAHTLVIEVSRTTSRRGGNNARNNQGTHHHHSPRPKKSDPPAYGAQQQPIPFLFPNAALMAPNYYYCDPATLWQSAFAAGAQYRISYQHSKAAKELF